MPPRKPVPQRRVVAICPWSETGGRFTSVEGASAELQLLENENQIMPDVSFPAHTPSPPHDRRGRRGARTRRSFGSDTED